MRKKNFGWRVPQRPLAIQNVERNKFRNVFNPKQRINRRRKISSIISSNFTVQRPPQTNADWDNVADVKLSTTLDHEKALARTVLARNIEALLFMTREPLSVKRLAQLLSYENTNEILDAIQQLNLIYDAAPCAFRILEFARGFQLRTRPQFTPWLRQLCRQEGVENQESPEIRLSPPAMETLAIIAYREAFNTPATRAEIEAIRGVQSCMEILRQLLGKDLIRIAGRSAELGRPRLYRTTKKFLEVFGLKSLLQLPRVDLS